ncbi:MAG TPA: hypothetical protein VGR26_18755 [Acidimicrobiales bacterium]|nr:hypothetical protein [Acidimicrobiales bacterium]
MAYVQLYAYSRQRWRPVRVWLLMVGSAPASYRWRNSGNAPRRGFRLADPSPARSPSANCDDRAGRRA